jgi:hypothetical protein
LRPSTSLAFINLGTALVVTSCSSDPRQVDSATPDVSLVAKGKAVFRFDTFGDESQWTDVLRMHDVIRTAVDP